jgi:hypothetical protein
MTERRESVAESSSDTELIARTLELCVGLLEEKTKSWETVAKLLEEEADSCRERARLGGAKDKYSDHVEIEASNVIHDWHRLPEYLDEQGSPIPLALHGEQGSIEAIARRCPLSSEEVQELLDLVTSLQAVRKTRGGRYLPTNYTLMVTASRRAMLRRGVKILGGLVSTLSHNLSEPDPALREFERWAHVPRVRASEIPAFRKYLAVQGRMFIEAVDSWLTARQVDPAEARSSTPTVEVIVEAMSNVSPGNGSSEEAETRKVRGQIAR